MEFRYALETDVPAIITLLKQSLGESLMPKSERYWKWKHQENPFGVSPVLLCFDGDRLVGVRAFMRWTWMSAGRSYRAVRAVDTATHPEYQGKGIFKKLTLSLVEHCKQEGDLFVFNTPNQQSKPGYLKMGWAEAGKLPISISLRRPFHMAKNIISHSSSEQPLGEEETSALNDYLSNPTLSNLIAEHARQRQATMTTQYSTAYLAWRYLHVPVVSYWAISDEQEGALTGLVIGRIKTTRAGRELRITDCFLRSGVNTTALRKKLKEAKEKWKIDYTTWSAAVDDQSRTLLQGMTLPVGPIVTVRSVLQDDLQGLLKFSQWSPSLGDLELF